MKPSPQEKPYQRPTQALKVNSELSYIPAKLLGFSSPRVQHPLLPSLSSKPNIQPTSERKIRQKKSESPTILQEEPSHPGLVRHAHHNSLSKLADDFLKVDKQSHAKPDLLRASKDVSYLLETKKFQQQKTVNEFFNKTITQSVHLLSPEKQNAFLSKTLYRPDPTSTDQTQVQGIEAPSLFAQSRMSDHHKSHDTLRLPTSLGKLRNFITTEEEDYIPPRSARLTSQTARNKSNFQTPRTRSPNKIVDSVAVGLGPNNHIELDQNDVKEGLKKVKEKTIVEHRSQNMKLAIPSGRKEVIALSGWLNNMLEGIYKEDEIKTEKVFEDVQLIYTACLQEIIRQVKVQCGERGQLLEKIWEAYIDIFDKVIRENAKVRREIEKEHLQEMEEVSKVYQKRLDLMEYEMNLVKKDRTEVKETLEKRKEEVAYLKKKVDKQDGQLMSHKDLVEEVRDEMDRVKNENAELRRLVLESEVQIQKRYVEVQKNISERYEIKRAEAHKRKESEPDRLKNRIYDPMREKNLNENLNMMDKLDDVIEGFAIRDQEDIEDRSPRGVIEDGDKSEEDLFKEIGVDTDDLEVVPEIEKMDQEVQCDIEIPTPIIIVEQTPIVEITENKEEEIVVQEEKSSKEKTSSSDDSSDSSDGSSDDSSSGDSGSSSKKSKKSQKSQETKENEENEEESNKKMEEMMKELGKKRIYDKINKLTKSESYKILNNVERKLYEKVSQEEDGDMKTNLINVLGMMIRQEIGLENEDYQDLVTKVVEKNMERAKTPSEDLAEVLEAVKEMSKDELLEVLGLLQTRWKKEGEGKVKEVKESDDLMRFMVEILKGSETVEIKNKELGGLLLKVRQLQSKRQERLNFMDTMEEEAQKTAREAENEAEKVNFLEEMKRRLNGTIGAVGINGLNRELVNILERNVSDRGDLAETDLKVLLNNALGALDKTLVQITALKVENQEQNIDIQELNEVKETKDQQVARLEKELQEYKNRAKFAERESDKMSRKLFKIQSNFEEKNKMKMAKYNTKVKFSNSSNRLASVMQNMSRFRDMYRGRASFAHPLPESFADSPLLKKPTISVTDYDNGVGDNDPKAASLVITSYSEQPESPTIKDNVDYTEKIIENIESLISDDEKDGIEEIEEEENWSEKEDEEEIKKKKFEQEVMQGGTGDIKIFKSLGKKIIGKVAKQGETNKANKILRILSVNADSAIALLARAKEKKNLKASLPKLTVLKFISQIYIERLKVSGSLREMPLYIVTYDYFINKYGLKRVAESKCQQMFESILSYKENRRIARFKDLLGLGEGLESGELELYFSTFKHFDPLGNGTIIASNILEKTLILFVINGRDLEFLFIKEYAELAAASLFDKKIDPQNMKLLISKLNQWKISDNKGGKAMIEFEDAVDEFLTVERGLQDKVKGYVKDVFNAADLDNDEIIMFSEFDILYKQLEKERYNKDKVKKLFFEQADFILPDGSNERVVSFNKFARICLETGLFSKDKQVIFAKVSDPADKIQTMQDLEENLKSRLNEIRLRFMKCNSYNIQIKGAVTTLYNSIRNPLKPRNIVWLTYRLLDEESKTQLLSYEIKKMLPKELQIIQKFVEDYEDWS